MPQPSLKIISKKNQSCQYGLVAGRFLLYPGVRQLCPTDFFQPHRSCYISFDRAWSADSESIKISKICCAVLEKSSKISLKVEKKNPKNRICVIKNE